VGLEAGRGIEHGRRIRDFPLRIRGGVACYDRPTLIHRQGRTPSG
jgi:hypothetical protein